jgi:acyl-CoA synthetase (AMP-forming)/AMP-acid ligase II
MNLALWLERAGRSHPAAPAIGHGKRTVMDYGALALRAACIAGALREAGLAPGDRVAIAAKNHSDYLAILFGILHAGLAAVPANAKLHGAELGYILEHSGARICFASKDLESEIAAHAPKSLERLVTIGSREYEKLLSADPVPVEPRASDDLAWLFYTSGTTGKPKGAMLTHRNLTWASHAYAAEVDAVAPGEAIIHAAPLSHGSGLYAIPHVGRLGVNVIPESGSFEPDEIFSLFSHWTRPSMFAAPTMIKRLVESGADCDPATIRTLIWGGAPMYVEDALKAIDRFGDRLAQIYGPQASEAALKDGWLHTGDVGVFDAEGYLTLKDRSKDMIISGGSNIYPREVEEILIAHEKIREVSVIGRPDAEWGEVVVAYVVGEANAKELDALCLERIARFKRPKDYVFVDALPKNNYGKILKTELRERDARRRKKHA